MISTRYEIAGKNSREQFRYSILSTMFWCMRLKWQATCREKITALPLTTSIFRYGEVGTVAMMAASLSSEKLPPPEVPISLVADWTGLELPALKETGEPFSSPAQPTIILACASMDDKKTLARRISPRAIRGSNPGTRFIRCRDSVTSRNCRINIWS